MTRAQKHVAVALATLVVALLACKHTYTPPGSKSDAGDASADVAEELDEEATGKCDEKQYANFKCLTRGRAAFCKTIYLHEYNRDMRTRGEWVTFTCPDCVNVNGPSRLKCSNIAPGEPCASAVEDFCAPDKHSVYECDMQTSTWKMRSCSKSCKDDPPFKPTCND